ncbi:MAG: hypothetical protein WC671_03555 [Candidatus Paceibacterota bacterium]|jgi:ABC-2 type transport system permease protein
MKKILKKLKLPAKIITTLIKDRIQYPSRLVVDTLGIISRCVVLIFLYWSVFKLNNGTINGTTFIFVAWSIFFYFAFSVLHLRDIARLMMQDIQTGNVEILLSKPVSYLSYKMWWQFGAGLYSFLIITILGTIVLGLTVGFPATMGIGIFIPTLILTIVCGIILSLYLYTIIGLLAFWIQDVLPVFWIVDKAVMILGGSYLPIALFPPLMKKIALYTPFGASQFITHTIYETWQTDWYQLVGIQLFWIFLFGVFVYFMFKKAKQKVSVNGG